MPTSGPVTQTELSGNVDFGGMFEPAPGSLGGEGCLDRLLQQYAGSDPGGAGRLSQAALRRKAPPTVAQPRPRFGGTPEPSPAITATSDPDPTLALTPAPFEPPPDKTKAILRILPHQSHKILFLKFLFLIMYRNNGCF